MEPWTGQKYQAIHRHNSHEFSHSLVFYAVNQGGVSIVQQRKSWDKSIVNCTRNKTKYMYVVKRDVDSTEDVFKECMQGLPHTHLMSTKLTKSYTTNYFAASKAQWVIQGPESGMSLPGIIAFCSGELAKYNTRRERVSLHLADFTVKCIQS